jgi:glycosyltransferase involved in cell wall biosynthesis
MMRKIPVVATRIGGMQQTVAHGETGLLVAPADAAALAKAIGLVLADPVLAGRLGKAGRARALTHFSWARAADQLLEAYASVSKRRLQK